MVDAFGNPLATDLSSKLFAHYRDKRLTDEIYFSQKWKKGATPVTINLEQSYLSGVFCELARLGEETTPNPLENMCKITIAEKEMAWLPCEQITELLFDCQRHSPLLALVVKICFSTGARWREAVNLTRSQVIKYRITFVRIKAKKNRSIPISKELYEEIIAQEGFRFFTDCYFQFLSAMDQTFIVLPRGQLTRSAPYVRSTLHVVWRQHPCPAENPRSSRHKNDHALCPPRARSSGNGPTLQSLGNHGSIILKCSSRARLTFAKYH